MPFADGIGRTQNKVLIFIKVFEAWPQFACALRHPPESFECDTMEQYLFDGPLRGSMNNVLRYRGYLARVELESDSMVFAGRLLGMSETIEFHGASIDELVADFRFAVDHYLAECEKSGRAPERPASGRLLLRLPPETHAKASLAATARDMSLNQWIVQAIERQLESAG